MSDAPEIIKLKQRLSDLPDSISWKELWNLRTEVSDLIPGADPETRSILKATYDDFTKQLKVRAEELGKGKEFAEADRLTELVLKTEGLRAELDAASGVQFHDILSDPARKNELMALNALIEAGGLPADYLAERMDSLKANYRIAECGQIGEPLRLRDVLAAWIERFRENRKHDKK
jgi:hypothetical protein